MFDDRHEVQVKGVELTERLPEVEKDRGVVEGQPESQTLIRAL